MEIKRDTVPKEVSKEKLSNSYFFSGENEYKIKEFISVLKKKVLSPGFESFDLEKFDVIESEFDINDVIRAIMTPPMASLKRLVILDKVEKLIKDDRVKLLSVLESPNNSSILVIIASPSTKMKEAFWRKLTEKSRSENFRKLKGNSLEKWITDYFKKTDYSIEQDAVHAIIEFSGDNQISLASEIEKIITYVGEKRTLTKDDVLQVLTSNMVKNVFELNDAIGNRERKKAISTLDYLLEWGVVPDVIFGVLRYFFLRLRRMVYYKRKNLSTHDIAQKFGVRDFVVKKEVEYFSEDELKEKLNLLYRAEVRMKTGWDVNLVLTDLVYNLI